MALRVPIEYAALFAAVRSDLVAALPSRLVQSQQQALGLKIFTLPFGVPAELVVQAWHPRSQANAAHETLRWCARTVFEKKPPPLPGV